MKKTYSPQVEVVLGILRDEIHGDVRGALTKMTDDYTMTWVYQKKNGELFPSTTNDLGAELHEVYPIRGRTYDIKHIAEGEQVVMVEMIESYPDQKTGKIFRTPLVIVLELKDNKIRTGRHYTDPKLSYLELSPADTDRAYKNSRGSVLFLSEESSRDETGS